MNLKIIYCVCISMILFACTPVKWPEVITFGSPGGYIKTIKLAPPPNICDPDTYINGYRPGYMMSWNREIIEKLNMYGEALRLNPQDAQTKSRAEFYKSKLFDLSNVYQKENRYGFVPSSPECEFHGRERGMNDAARDVEALGQGIK